MLKKQKLEQELEKESISKQENEIFSFSENDKITREYVEVMVKKIVVSRNGSIEIDLKERWLIENQLHG